MLFFLFDDAKVRRFFGSAITFCGKLQKKCGIIDLNQRLVCGHKGFLRKYTLQWVYIEVHL